tara:strand:- start:181 stop:630 length:450 start_codon:yes stop_codon:yes gene_type:complete
MVPEKSLTILEPEKQQYKKKIPYSNDKKKLEVYDIINAENTIGAKNNIKEENYEKILKNKVDQKKSYRIQIASLKDDDKISTVYEKIKSEFPNYFQNKEPFIEKILIDKKGYFYRVQSQELYNKKNAEKLCILLVSKKFNCYMVKVNAK